MCGIVGAVSERDVQGILLEGLRRLEYRGGYDSAGMAVINGQHLVQRAREVGKVAALADAIEANPPLAGHLGIAHTRWATHGEPSQVNAHPPHMSGERLAIVHNGIIENYQELRDELRAEGFEFTSQTDTEVVAHLIEKYFREQGKLYEAVKSAIQRLRGATPWPLFMPMSRITWWSVARAALWWLASVLARTLSRLTSWPCCR